MQEERRVAELHRLGILDTPPEAHFESLVRAAAAIAGAPTALVSLVDEDRQWFKAALHFALRETPRDQSFCAHAILQPDEVMVVSDTAADPRFAENTLVTEDPRIRFYAGAPLKTGSGEALGTLCVLDYEPRDITPEQREALQALAQQVVMAIEARAQLHALSETLTGRRRATSPEALQAILDGSPSPLYIKDTHGRYLLVNRAAAAFVGVEPAASLGHTDEELFEPEFAAALAVNDRRVLESGRPLESEDAGVDAHGNRHVFVARRFPLTDWSGQVYAVCAMFTDITERERAEREMRRSDAIRSAVLSGADDAILLLDGDGRVLEANPAAARMLPGPLAGRPLADALGIRRGPAARRIPPAGQPLTGDRIELRVRRPDGSELPIEATFSRLGDGRDPLWCAFLHDITERRRFEDALRTLAEADPLTGLTNRTAFERDLERHVQHQSGALLVLDLDHFSQLNESYGHRAGDQFLASLGRPLDAVAGVQQAARLGGDVFAVLTDGDAEAVADRLLDTVREHVLPLESGRLRTTASVGLVRFRHGHAGGLELLAAADRAMRAAKAAGRDRVVALDASRPSEVPALPRRTVADRVRAALAEDDFALHAQPIVDLRDGSVTHYELLLRMVGEDRELVPPGDFVPAAERYDLIQAIDRWVVPRAIAMAAEARRAGLPACFEVNLSGRSIGDPALLTAIADGLAEHELDGSQLVFEITETAAISHLAAARTFADTLHDLGCAFAVDDFGTGFGSFAYLKHLPADYVKIDRDFVRDLARSQVDQEIVRSVVSVARVLGARTIAEGIEHADAQQLLTAYGVELGQGFLHGAPAPVEDVLRS